MVKKIGRVFWGIFICGQLASGAPSVLLHITDSQGLPLKQAGIGVPFEVHVVVQDLSRESRVEFKGIDQLKNSFDVTSHGVMQHFYVGSNSTTFSKVTYKFNVRIDQEGSYTIGPARVEIDGSPLSSQAHALVVGLVAQVQDTEQQKQALLHMAVDSDEIFIEQEVPLTLTFYAVPGTILVDEPHLKISDFSFDSFGNPEEGTWELNGVSYQYVRWRTILYPKNVGRFVIPASFVHIEPYASGWLPLSFFARKQIVSNALVLNVQPIPAYDRPVDAVGIFDQFEFVVDQKKATQGEGIVAKLTVHGMGSLKNLKTPVLNLPKQLRAYESKNYIDQSKGTKTFEYIIQATQSGAIEIPMQQFTFFNPATKKFTTLTSTVLSLDITAGGTDLTAGPEPTTQQAEKHTYQSNAEVNDIAPLEMYGPWHPVPERAIPLRWFLFLLLLPMAYLFGRLILIIVRWIRMHYACEIKRKRAFFVARKCMTLYEEQHDSSALYPLFISLIAARAKKDESSISHEFIQNYLFSVGFEHAKVEQWDQFFVTLAQERFFSKNEVGQPLFARSRYWIIELEKRL